MQAVERNQGVRKLASNPLLLTILALMKRQGKTLPEERAALYELYVKTLLKQWTLARGLAKRDEQQIMQVEDAGKTIKVLAPLALWMHKMSPGVGLVRETDLKQQLHLICREQGRANPEQVAKQLWQDVHDHTCLLVERGNEWYGFIHLTLQKYLAAMAIAQKGQEEVSPIVLELKDHIGDGNWDEIIALTVGYVGIVQRRDRAAGKILEQLVGLELSEKGVDSLPIAEMCQLNWIRFYHHPVNQVREALQFFGVASVGQWERVWNEQFADVTFRQSTVGIIGQGSVASWLRKGELEAQTITAQPYDAHSFQQTLGKIRGFTRQPVQNVWVEVVSQCAMVGVAVVVVPALRNTGVSGATRWLTPEKALLQLSLRYKCDDQFWFSFFHEAGHILHHGKRKLFLQLETEDRNREEAEADRFAADLLIPPTQFRKFVAQSKGPYFSEKRVLDFAEELGIAPGIVVGRLQHEQYIPAKNLNGLRRSLSWNGEGQVVSMEKRL